MTNLEFWFVWNTDGTAPKFKHDSLTGARKEAVRLARANPGQEFIVLQSVCAFRANDVQEIDLRPDDIPF